MPVALEVNAIRSGYGETQILHDVSLSVESGQTYALVGKNGAGKTTLLKAILGLLPKRGGSVSVFGDDVTRDSPHRIAKHAVGYAPQENAFFPDLSVADNLRLGAMRLDRRTFDERRERVVELFPFLGQRMRQGAGTLSGGEQKMLNVARALLPSPRIVLLDEVSEGLQPSVVDRVRNALAHEQEQTGLTLLLVEQNIEFVLGAGGPYALLERGRVVDAGHLDDTDAREKIERHLAI
jgi:ABC-type branched-subunit amino acid transport system ATPase component